jgi:hypothetical protein
MISKRNAIHCIIRVIPEMFFAGKRLLGTAANTAAAAAGGPEMFFWIIFWIILSIILIPLLLLLVVPFSFSAQFRRDGINHFAASVYWLWGGVSLQAENTSGTFKAGPFTAKKFSFKRDSKAAKHKKKDQPEKTHRSTKSSNIKQYLDAALISAFLKSLFQAWAALSLRAEGRAVFGFEDPSLTGMVCGLLAAAGLYYRHTALTLTPDFLEPGLAGYLSIQGRFTVGRLLFIVFKFLLSQPVRRLWWSWLRRKEVAGKWRKSTLPTT